MPDNPRNDPEGEKPATRLEARRQAMLEAAAQLFFEVGYERSSVNEIVRRSGGSLTTLYQLFGSKEGLFEVMVQDRCTRILEPLSAADLSAKPPQEALRALGYRFMEVVYCPEVIAVIRTVVGEGAKLTNVAQIYFRNGPDNAIGKLSAYLAELDRTGAAHCPDPAFCAKSYFMLLHNDIFFRVLAGVRPPPDMAEIKAHVDKAVDLFWRAIAVE